MSSESESDIDVDGGAVGPLIEWPQLPFNKLHKFGMIKEQNYVLPEEARVVRRAVIKILAKECEKLKKEIDTNEEKRRIAKTTKKPAGGVTAKITTAKDTFTSYVSLLEWLCGRIPGVYRWCGRFYDPPEGSVMSDFQTYLSTGVTEARVLEEFDAVCRLPAARTDKFCDLAALYRIESGEFGSLVGSGVVVGNVTIRATDMPGISKAHDKLRVWMPITGEYLQDCLRIRKTKSKWIKDLVDTVAAAAGRKLRIPVKVGLYTRAETLADMLNCVPATWEKRQVEEARLEGPNSKPIPILLTIFFGDVLLPRHVVCHICEYFGQDRRALLDGLGMVNEEFCLTVLSLPRRVTTSEAGFWYLPYPVKKFCKVLELRGNVSSGVLKSMVGHLSPGVSIDLRRSDRTKKASSWKTFFAVLSEGCAIHEILLPDPRSESRDPQKADFLTLPKIQRRLDNIKSMSFDLEWICGVTPPMGSRGGLIKCPQLEKVSFQLERGCNRYAFPDAILVSLRPGLIAPNVRHVELAVFDHGVQDSQLRTEDWLMVKVAEWAAFYRVDSFTASSTDYTRYPACGWFSDLPAAAAKMLLPIVSRTVGVDFALSQQSDHGKKGVAGINLRHVEFAVNLGHVDESTSMARTFQGGGFLLESPLSRVAEFAEDYFCDSFPALEKLVLIFPDYRFTLDLIRRSLENVSFDCPPSRLAGPLANEVNRVAHFELKCFEGYRSGCYDTYIQTLKRLKLHVRIIPTWVDASDRGLRIEVVRD